MSKGTKMIISDAESVAWSHAFGIEKWSSNSSKWNLEEKPCASCRISKNTIPRDDREKINYVRTESSSNFIYPNEGIGKYR